MLDQQETRQSDCPQEADHSWRPRMHEQHMRHFNCITTSLSQAKFEEEADEKSSTSMLSKAKNLLMIAQTDEDLKRFFLFFMLLLVHMAHSLSFDMSDGLEFPHMLEFWKDVCNRINSLNSDYQISHPDLFLRTSDPLERQVLFLKILDFYRKIFSVHISVSDATDGSSLVVTACLFDD